MSNVGGEWLRKGRQQRTLTQDLTRHGPKAWRICLQRWDNQCFPIQFRCSGLFLRPSSAAGPSYRLPYYSTPLVAISVQVRCVSTSFFFTVQKSSFLDYGSGSFFKPSPAAGKIWSSRLMHEPRRSRGDVYAQRKRRRIA